MSTERISPDRWKKLRDLAKLMNRQNERVMPIIPPILHMMDYVLTGEELDFLLRMGTKSYTFDQAAGLVARPGGKFREFLDAVVAKGFVQRIMHDEAEDEYQLHPIVVGWFEWQLLYGIKSPDMGEHSRRAMEIFHYAGRFNFFPLRNLQNLVTQFGFKPNQRIGAINPPGAEGKGTRIEVGERIQAPDSKVYPAKGVMELIDEFGAKNQMALAPCICREMRRAVNDPCRFDFPYESCLTIGNFARTLVAYDYGRIISRGEALDVIQALRDKGTIHTIYHERDDLGLGEIAICNCCWDCCGLYGGYNRGQISVKFRSFYSAEIADDADCKGCEKCVRYCPTGTISIVNKKAVIDKRYCIGCGQCAHQCPKNLITLLPEERDVFLPLRKKKDSRLGAV